MSDATRKITFGTYQGQFAVLADGERIGSTWDDCMARVRAAGINTGNRVKDLCRFLGEDVLAAYEADRAASIARGARGPRVRFGRGSMMGGA